MASSPLRQSSLRLDELLKLAVLVLEQLVEFERAGLSVLVVLMNQDGSQDELVEPLDVV